MKKLNSALKAALLAAVIILPVGAFNAARADGSRTLCDALAASPLDGTRPAGTAGVEEEEIDVVRALPACKAALEAYTDDARMAFQLGRVLSKDGKADEAAALYAKAAEKGHTTAMVNYAFGMEEANPAEAFSWYQRAAGLGDALGQYNLAVSYADGMGTAIDITKAIEWYNKASDQGDAWATYNLAVLHDEGTAVPADKMEAIRLYKLAVARGHVDAMINLAITYEEGQDVPADPAAALELYRLAAEKGDQEAKDAAERLQAAEAVE